MTKLEMAIRYLCFAEEDETEIMANRYKIIYAMVHDGDEDMIERYSKRYDKLLSLLCN